MSTGSRDPGALQSPTMEPGSGPGGRRSPEASEDNRKGGGDLSRQLRELVIRGHQKASAPTMDSNQQASGPWLTPNCIVNATAEVFFVQPCSVESLSNRRLAI